MEFLRQLHDAECLAVPFRAGHSEIPSDLLLDVPSFLMPHHRHGHSLIRGEAPHDGRVVSKLPISMDFHQVSEEHLDVIQCVRALGVTGYLGLLPGGEAGVNLASEVLEFLPETLDLRSAIIAPRDPRHLLDALFQLLDGLLDVNTCGLRRRLMPAVRP